MTIYKPLKNVLDYASKLKENSIPLLMVAYLAALSSLYPSNNLTKHLREPIPKPLRDNYEVGVEFLGQYRQELVDNSRNIKVPWEFVASLIFTENYRREVWEDLKDLVGTGWRGKFWDYEVMPRIGFLEVKFPHPRFPQYTDPSLGPGQVKVCTAKGLFRKLGLGEPSRAELEEILKDPVTNIKFTALALEDIMTGLYGYTTILRIFEHPEKLGYVANRYFGGPAKTHPNDIVINYKAREFLLLLGSINFQAIFGEYATITPSQQRGIREFVEKLPQEGIRIISQKPRKPTKPKTPVLRKRC